MKNLVSNVASGFSEEVFVYFLYIGAFVRLPELVCVIKAVESFCTLCTDIRKVAYICRLDNLTAAVYTSAGTSHDLDEVAFYLAVLKFGKELLSVCKTRYNSYLYSKVAYLVFSRLDTLNASYILEFNGAVCGFACQLPYSCTKSRFHNAARSAEDNSGACAVS